MTITSLEDDVFGTLDDDADCQIGTVLDQGEICEFQQELEVVGQGGTTHVNTFIGEAEDDDSDTVDDDDDAEVLILDPINIFIEKSPDPETNSSGQEVTFTMQFRHNLPFTIYLVSIVDDPYGDVLDPDNDHPDLRSNTCAGT